MKILIPFLLIIPILLFSGLFSIMSISNPNSNGEAAKVAIILPHPDDETIGMGGTIQMLKENGTRVHCELMTSGNAITPKLRPVVNYYNISIPTNASEKFKKKLIREDAFKRIMAIYGCDYNIEGYDDGDLNSDIVFKTMENLYLNDGYTEFYTVTGDGNVDHLACHQAMIKMKEKYPNLKYREFPVYWYRANRTASMPILNNYKDLDVNIYGLKKKNAFQVYYNINTITPDFYPYSSGKYSVSPERIYYIN